MDNNTDGGYSISTRIGLVRRDYEMACKPEQLEMLEPVCSSCGIVESEAGPPHEENQ